VKTLSQMLSVKTAVMILLCVLGATAAMAAGTESSKQPAVAGAELRLLNRPIISFRDSALGTAPEQRAARAERNLTEILARNSTPDVSVQTNALGNIIMVDHEIAFVITEGDVDKSNAETLQSLTARTLGRLRQALEESSESRNGRQLMINLGIAVGEILLFLLIVLGLTRLRGVVSTRLLQAIEHHARSSRFAEAGLIRWDRLLLAARWAVNAIYWMLVSLLAYKLISLVFGRFPYTRPWGDELDGYLLDLILTIGRGIISTVPDLFFVVVLLLIARAVMGMLKPLFDRIESGHEGFGWLDRDTVGPTRKITNILIWVFALVMAYPYLPGSHTEAFKGMSVLIGLMVSLGASSVVGQAASGLILMYSRVLRRGEYVRVGDYEGTIVDLGLFTTRMRTGRGTEIALPNSMIVGNAAQNYSRTASGRGYVLDTVVTIGYDTPWRQVEAMLNEAARRTPGMQSSPPPRVFQTALSDFYPEYCLSFQAIPDTPLTRTDLMSILHAHIQDVFNEYGVQIMSPHYLGDPDTEKTVPPDKWFSAPAREPAD